MSRLIKNHLRSAVAATYHFIYRSIMPIRWWISDQFGNSATPGFVLPPAKLRYRVGESVRPEVYLRVGEASAMNIQAVLLDAGYRPSNFREILDFGCGCGRTLQWLQRQIHDATWYGTDVDAEAIEWCRKHL